MMKNQRMHDLLKTLHCESKSQECNFFFLNSTSLLLNFGYGCVFFVEVGLILFLDTRNNFSSSPRCHQGNSYDSSSKPVTRVEINQFWLSTSQNFTNSCSLFSCQIATDNDKVEISIRELCNAETEKS